MLAYVWYFIKIIICSGILFGYYWIFLRNKIYHQYNRFYLLASLVLSLLLPLTRINIGATGAATHGQAIQLLQAVSSSDAYMEDVVIKGHHNNFDITWLSSLLYLGVSAIFFCFFLHVLYTIRKLVYKYKGQVIEHFYFVNTDAKGTPFSFLNYIFWNDAIDINTTTGRQIFKHEVAHIREKHSYDKLFINVLLIVSWFNPFFWLMRKELNMIHEFIADKKAIADCDTAAFAAMILQASYPRHRFELVNNFFYSPIKRRLAMLTKNKNPRVNYFSRLMVLPLAALIFAAFTLKTNSAKQQLPGFYFVEKKLTVVIDAGHGGSDAGARSLSGDLEKDIALSIAKKIKALNGYENIEIVLTREDDIYQSPPEKVAFAKQHNAALFISIHLDAAPAGAADAKSGMSVTVARDKFPNAAASKVLASAMISEFSANYGIPVSQFPQQRQIGIWVLQANDCPSVLIEAGYMTNSKDINYLKTEEGQERTAKNILAAIARYASNKQENTGAVKITTTKLPDPSDIQSKKYPDTLVWVQENGGKLKEGIIQTGKAPSPLYVLDGKELGFGDEAKAKLKNVSPNTIGEVNVLKDKPAIDKYGDKGKNGVIEIITKETISIVEEPVAAKAINDNRVSANDLPEQVIFQKAETEPEFPGGQDAWRQYLTRNLNASLPVEEGWKAGKYVVIISFIVEKDGSISNVTTTNYKDSKTAKHCIDMISKGPKWIPATQNGRAVPAYKKQPVTFVIEEAK